jgi:hypothetical protein
MRLSTQLAVALIAGAGALATLPANAAPLMLSPGLQNSAPALTETIQYRRWHGGGYGYRGGYYRRGPGPGAVIGGLAAGAIIGGAIAASQAQAAQNQAVAYCSQRYRSYDPGSGTYLNNDGNRYPCP